MNSRKRTGGCHRKLGRSARGRLSASAEVFFTRVIKTRFDCTRLFWRVRRPGSKPSSVRHGSAFTHDADSPGRDVCRYNGLCPRRPTMGQLICRQTADICPSPRRAGEERHFLTRMSSASLTG